MERSDVLIVGAGHNGLVAATLLAQRGLKVHVVEEKPVVGGAVRTERPFARAPGLATSTGAYLLGLMPPELLPKLGISLPLVRRDPHYFLPRLSHGYLLLGSDPEETRRQFVDFFSEADYRAHCALQTELGQIRDDIAATWLTAPLSIEETAERHVRPALREVFVDLCRKPVRDYLGRFDFRSELVLAMYAVTDAFSGLCAGWETPGTGMNFLVHNMCRLPGADGTWMIVQGGMGTVSQTLAAAAQRHGATLETNAGVKRIVLSGGHVSGVELLDGRELSAKVVVVNADPFRMRDLIGRERLSAEYNHRLDGYARDGTTLKVNLALSELPTFTCLPEQRGQHHTTIHILPQEDVLNQLGRAFDAARSGRLPDFPAIEWYTHTTVDPALRDDQGRHNAALFVQWVPYQIEGSSWDAEESGYVDHLLAICDRFAPGFSRLVVDRFTLHPAGIERHFGMTRGHIHHVDNTFGFADRLPVATPIAGLYSASAACHPAGSVIGAAGHNAAQRVLSDLDLPES